MKKMEAAKEKEAQAVLAAMELEYQFVRKAQYGKALKLAKLIWKKYPRNPVAQYRYAVLLGDNNEGLNEKQIEKNRKIAAKMLKSVVGRLQEIPENLRPGVQNEYFWFSRQPLKQYQLGVARVAESKRHGYYSQGVGAISYAEIWARKGNVKEVRKWAMKSKTAWENYFKVNPTYYNAWCWYALALGIVGNFNEMEKALRRASELSGRGWDYSEFADFQWKAWKARMALEKKIGPKGRKYWELPPGWFIEDLDLRKDLLGAVRQSNEKFFVFDHEKHHKMIKKYPLNLYAKSLAAALHADFIHFRKKR